MDKCEKLDEAVAETFPASDPVAPAQPHETPKPDASAAKQPKPRSPDWMFAKP